MNKKMLTLLAVVWTAAIGLVGFSELRAENAPESSQQASQQISRQAASNDSGKSADDPRAPESTQRDAAERESTEREPGSKEIGVQKGVQKATSGSQSKKSRTKKVTLQVTGEPGVEFSGRCSVDGEERGIEGRTPETYDYEPEERLECKLSSRGGGMMRVTFSDGGGTSSTQQVGPGSSSLELAYTGDGFSLSTSPSSRSVDSGGSQTSSQKNQANQTNSSQVISSQSSSQTSYPQTSSSVVRQSGSE